MKMKMANSGSKRLTMIFWDITVFDIHLLLWCNNICFFCLLQHSRGSWCWGGRWMNLLTKESIHVSTWYQENTWNKHRSNVGLLLGQRHRRRANNKSVFCQRLVSARWRVILNKFWSNAGPTLWMLAQHWTNRVANVSLFSRDYSQVEC